MNSSSRPPLTPAQIEALEARFALRVASRLDDALPALPHDITERLRVARQQAIGLALAPRAATAVAPATLGAPVSAPLVTPVLAGAGAGGNAMVWVSRPHARHSATPVLNEPPPGWGWRLASALPVLALVAGLWGVNVHERREQVEAASVVDMALLTDELPPAAYADPGFEEYLRSTDAAVQAPAAHVELAPPEGMTPTASHLYGPPYPGPR